MKSRRSNSRCRPLAAVALASLLALAACGSSDSSGKSSEGVPDTIPVTVIVPMTGPLATFGEQVVAGVKAGAASVEKSGALGDSTFDIKVEDDGSDATTAASLTQSAVRSDVVGIIGSPISNEALASGPIANSARIPFLATSAPGTQLPEIGEYVYSMTTPQSVLLASYLKGLVPDAPKVTVIYARDNDTTTTLNDAIKKQVPDLGGTVVNDVSTTLTATDTRVVATKALEGSPDAIGVLSGGAQLPAMVSALRSLGYQGRIFANGGADVSAPAAGSAVDGLEFQGEWAPDVTGALSTDFAASMKAASPDMVPHYPAVNGFNAIRFLAEGIAKANATDGEKVVKALQDVVAGGKFESPGGVVTFTGEGSRQLEGPVYDLKIQGGVVSTQK
jgi:branched-chain amino acid transport system substrate-binding protein